MRRHDPQRVRAELDRLCELANAGAGRAAGALADLLGCPIRMEPPRLRVLAGAEPPPGIALGPETTGIFFEVEGGMGGAFAVLFPRRGREALLHALQGDPEPRSEQTESALREVGNILASHALSAVADLVGSRVLPSLPVLALEAAGAVLASFHARGGPLLIECRLVDGGGALRALLTWVPASPAGEASDPGV